MATRLAFTHDALANHHPVPTGRCQYFDLTAGTGAPVCPCQRFYQDSSQPAVSCFCGHHACFHGSASGPASVAGSAVGSIAATQSTIPLYPMVPVGGAQALTHSLTKSLASLDQLRNGSPPARACTSDKSTVTPPQDIWGAYREHMRHQRARGLVENSSALPSTAPAFTLSHSPPTSDEPGISLRELQNITAANSKRLNALESLSYSHVPLEEVEDKFQSLETRIGALEDFRAEMSSTASGHFGAVNSIEADNSENDSRLRDLEESVERLSDLWPTHVWPWEIEVVLLPWGRCLSGIWFHNASDDILPRTQDQWDRSNTTGANAFTESFSGRSGWSSGSIEAWVSGAAHWLDAKACGPNSLVWKRLHSRGLIKKVEVTSNDASSLMQKCRSAFSHLLDSVRRDDEPLATARAKCASLDQPLIPLRKIKKDSILQFLSPSEMITSATWTPSMLDSSVIMKASGLRRLYITTPAAYVQSNDDGFTWAQLRDQPWPDCHPHPPSDVGHLEACWKPHVLLDVHPSDPSSSAQCSKCQHESSSDQFPRAALERNELPASQLQGEHDRNEPIAIVVGDDATTLRANSTKRLTENDEMMDHELKRRRLSASPNTVRPGPSRTPRLSREPSLPFTSDGYLDHLSVGRTINTPAGYPTPHSHHIHTISTVRMTDDEGDLFANVSLRELSPFRTSDQSQENSQERDGAED